MNINFFKQFVGVEQKQTTEVLLERNFKIVELFVEQHKSYTEISEICNLTRQRTCQILQKSIGKETIKEFIKENKNIRHKNFISKFPTSDCISCNKKFTKKYLNTKFCCKTCRISFFENKRNDPERIKKIKEEQYKFIKKWQKKNPEKMKEYAIRANEKLKNNPEKRKARNKKIRESLITKLGSAEAYNAYMTKKSRNYLNKIKEDPIKFLKYKEKVKKRREKNRLKIKEKSKEWYENMRENNPEQFKILKEKNSIRSKERYNRLKEKRDIIKEFKKKTKNTAVFFG
jgi:hypothetical protein